MLLTYKQLETAYKRAEEYEDRDEFVRAYLEEIGQITEDGKADIELVDQLRWIHRAIHITIQDIKAISGLSYSDLSRRFCIKKRTFEDWVSDKASSKAPRFVLMAMLAAVEHRPIDDYPIVPHGKQKLHPEVSTNWSGRAKEQNKE